MPAISAELRRSRHNGILDAAKKAFAEHGFEAVSIAQIAKAAGVSDGLVYHYFRDKRDLLFHVLNAFYERIIVDLDETVLRERTFGERLEALIRTHLRVFVSDTDLCRLFIAEVRVAADYQGSAIQELTRDYTSVLLRIANAVPSALLRDAIFGAIEHRAWRFVNGQGRLNVTDTSRDLTRLFLHGLCGPAARG